MRRRSAVARTGNAREHTGTTRQHFGQRWAALNSDLALWARELWINSRFFFARHATFLSGSARGAIARSSSHYVAGWSSLRGRAPFCEF